MREIKVSKHCLEEYIIDNPKKKNPEKSVIYLFRRMLWESKRWNAKFYKYSDREASIIRYKDQAIVYNDYFLITYYRIFIKEITDFKIKIVKQIDNILSWELEKSIDNIKKQLKKKYKKRNIKILNENSRILKKIRFN